MRGLSVRSERAKERGEEDDEGSLHNDIDAKTLRVFEDISVEPGERRRRARSGVVYPRRLIWRELLTLDRQQIVEKINLHGAHGLSLLWAHD